MEWFSAAVLLLRVTHLMVRFHTKGNCFCCNIMYLVLYYSNLNSRMVPVQPETNVYVLSRLGVRIN
jgi:hypothetical protein